MCYASRIENGARRASYRRWWCIRTEEFSKEFRITNLTVIT